MSARHIISFSRQNSSPLRVLCSPCNYLVSSLSDGPQLDDIISIFEECVSYPAMNVLSEMQKQHTNIKHNAGRDILLV